MKHRYLSIVGAVLLSLCGNVYGEDRVYIVVGVEHTSSPMNGTPANSKQETAFDMPYVGVKYYKHTWDMNIQFDVGHIIQSNEMSGSNPRFQFTIEKQFRIR